MSVIVLDGDAPGEQAATELGRFVGRITSVDTGLGFGFIECEALRQRCPRGAFLAKAHIGDCGIGDNVSFDAVVHAHGLLQARGLSPLGSPGPPGQNAAELGAMARELCSEAQLGAVPEFSLQQLANTAWAFATLRCWDHPL
eukprot:CAMPEP_0180440082 /NCGR_PEP_ID=MMETSP1036_2-20121128/12923_1 /TAXON_ID=632150 /ORGANISM="Azadinium spinosum, Strain 3D9" /LENGTH=141 /DNA_ID=CAMNT_0022446247 /DNA_START=350 /DNA_END=771 /DNA_ORIENTATION=-